mgnify:CR=1 FL=1
MKWSSSMAAMDRSRVHTLLLGSYAVASTCGVGGREGERWCEEGDAEAK